MFKFINEGCVDTKMALNCPKFISKGSLSKRVSKLYD